MRKWLFALLLGYSTITAAQAQQPVFVFLQTENLAPFYVKMGGKHLSSTAGGYLILSKLSPDTTLRLTLGVVGSTEQQDYVITTQTDDAGYMVRNFGAKGWGLQNMHTQQLQMSHEISAKMETEAARKPAAEAAAVAVPAAATAAAVEKKPEVQPIAKTETPAPKFLDMEVGGDSTKVVATPAAAAPDSARLIPQTDSLRPVPAVTMVVPDSAAARKSRVPCVASATRDDVDALLTSLQAAGQDADKIVAAIDKALQQKCMSTQQLGKVAKSLPSDALRLKLFERAWPHTLDYFNFAELRQLLTDEGAIAQFNQLLQ